MTKCHGGSRNGMSNARHRLRVWSHTRHTSGQSLENVTRSQNHFLKGSYFWEEWKQRFKEMRLDPVRDYR